MSGEDEERRQRILLGFARLRSKAATPEAAAEPNDAAPEPAPISARAKPMPRTVIDTMILQWWRSRADALVAASEAAMAAGEEVGEFDRKRVPVEWLIEQAEAADAMIAKMEAEERER